MNPYNATQFHWILPFKDASCALPLVQSHDYHQTCLAVLSTTTSTVACRDDQSVVHIRWNNRNLRYGYIEPLSLPSFPFRWKESMWQYS